MTDFQPIVVAPDCAKPAWLDKKLLTVIGTLLTLTGCATTQSLTPTQCQQGNWSAIGYQDGLMGQAPDYINHHTQRCATINTSLTTTQLQQWQQGYRQGIAKYCTPLRAYQLGREGIRYHNVCPVEQTLDLLKAHDEGYYYYQREQSLYDLNYGYEPFWNDRFDFPFDEYRHDGYRGFGRYGFSRSLAIPNSLPTYVDIEPDTKKAKTNSPSN